MVRQEIGIGKAYFRKDLRVSGYLIPLRKEPAQVDEASYERLEAEWGKIIGFEGVGNACEHVSVCSRMLKQGTAHRLENSIWNN